jgi:hypothetical protein
MSPGTSLPAHSPSSGVRPVALWFIVGTLVGIAVMWAQASSLGGWSALINVGTNSPFRPVIEAEFNELQTVAVGNDGQITYIIARDPLGQQYTDLVPQPSLRWRRLVFPAVGGLFGALQGEALLWSLIAWSAAALGVASAAFRMVLDRIGASPWAMLGVLGNPGVWLGLQIMTPDPLGLAFGIAGLALALHGRDRPAILALVLAAMTKEPYLLFAAALGAWRFFSGERGRGLKLFGVPALAFIAWSAVMSLVIDGPAWESGNIAPPFVGLVRAASYWPDFPARENLLTGIAIGMIILAITAALLTRDRFLQWQIASWATLAVITSEWVWRFGNGNLRAFAPIGAFAAAAFGVRLRKSHATTRQ